MRISNAVFFGGCSLGTAVGAALAWWNVVSANASGLIARGRFSPMISRAADPIAFRNQYHSSFSAAVVFTGVAVIFFVAALFSYIRNR